MIQRILKRAKANSRDNQWSTSAQNRAIEDQTLFRQGSPVCFEDLPLEVNWLLTNACNYRCSYCFDAQGEYRDNSCTLEQAETAIKHIAWENRPSYHVTLLGGEPSLHPCLTEIITLFGEHLGERLEKVIIITNGSFDSKTMEAMNGLASTVRMSISVSIHVEFARIEQLSSLVRCCSDKVSIDFKVMLHPVLFDKTREIVDALCGLREDHAFNMHFGMLREPSAFIEDDKRYTEEQLSWSREVLERFDDIASKSDAVMPALPRNERFDYLVERKVDGRLVAESPLSQDGLRELTDYRFAGMQCCTGAHIIHIDPDGTARGRVCGRGARTCNIYLENPFEKEGWIYAYECDKPRCSCSVDYCIPKFRDSAQAQEFIAECRRRQCELSMGKAHTPFRANA